MEFYVQNNYQHTTQQNEHKKKTTGQRKLIFLWQMFPKHFHFFVRFGIKRKKRRCQSTIPVTFASRAISFNAFCAEAFVVGPFLVEFS